MTASIRLEDCENPGEPQRIHAVNQAAFGGSFEADLVDRLRTEGHALLSLVAEIEGVIVGHVLFSRMAIKTPSGLIPAVALAPLAVLPEYQRRGIGGELTRRGIELLRARQERIVLVLGHPGYYPKFGFSAEKASLLESPFPPDAFLALELSPGALNGLRGTVLYPPPFGI